MFFMWTMLFLYHVGAIGVALGAGATGVYSTNGQLWDTLHRVSRRTLLIHDLLPRICSYLLSIKGNQQAA